MTKPLNIPARQSINSTGNFTHRVHEERNHNGFVLKLPDGTNVCNVCGRSFEDEELDQLPKFF